MRIKEFLIVVLIVLICYGLAFSIDSGIPFIIMNILLTLFYILFIRGSLPTSFYPDNEGKLKIQDKTIITVGLIILMAPLFGCLINKLSPFKILKIIERIAIIIFVITFVFQLFYGFYKRLFLDMPSEGLKIYLWNYVRGILIFSSNLFFIIFSTYTMESEYSNGKLVHKTVIDGCDTYETKFNDSLNVYQTKVHIEDTNPQLDYIIYYDEYPDKINHIDTICVNSN